MQDGATTTVSSIRSGTTATDVGLGNVDNNSTATILGGNLTGTVDGTAAGTVKSGAASGATANQDSTADIRSGTTASNVGLGNVQNLSASNQLITGWSTTITAGGLALGNSSGARIVLDATSSAPRIEVYDS